MNILGYKLAYSEDTVTCIINFTEKSFTFHELMELYTNIINAKKYFLKIIINRMDTTPHLFFNILIINTNTEVEIIFNENISTTQKVRFFSLYNNINFNETFPPTSGTSEYKTIADKEIIIKSLKNDTQRLINNQIFNEYRIASKDRRKGTNVVNQISKNDQAKLSEYITLYISELLNNISKHTEDNTKAYFIAKNIKEKEKVVGISIIIFDNNKEGILETLSKRLEKEKEQTNISEVKKQLISDIDKINSNPNIFFKKLFSNDGIELLYQLPHFLTHFGIPSFLSFINNINGKFEVITSNKGYILSNNQDYINKQTFTGTIYNIEIMIDELLVDIAKKHVYNTPKKGKTHTYNTPTNNKCDKSFLNDTKISFDNNVIKYSNQHKDEKNILTFKYENNYDNFMDFFRVIAYEAFQKNSKSIVIYNIKDNKIKNIFLSVYGQIMHYIDNTIITLFFNNEFIPYIIGGKDKSQYHFLNVLSAISFGGNVAKAKLDFPNNEENSIINNLIYEDKENNQFFIPLDLIIKYDISNTKNKKSYLFEHNLYRTLTEENRIRYKNLHTETSEKTHIQDFFYAKRIFQDSFWTQRYAQLIAKNIKDTVKSTSKDNTIFLIGYKSYSGLLLEQIRYYLPEDTITITTNEKVNYYEKIQPNINNYVFLIFPIGTTLESAKKVEFEVINYCQGKKVEFQNKKSSQEIYFLDKSYYILLTPDIGENEVLAKLKKLKWSNTIIKLNIIDFQYQFNKLCKSSNIYIHEQYYTLDYNSKEIIDKQIDYINKNNFFLTIETKWHNTYDCQLCFDKNKSIALFKMSQTNISPLMTLGVPASKIVANSNIRLLSDSVMYGHYERDHNHFLYYIDTLSILRNKKEDIKSILKNLVKNKKIKVSKYKKSFLLFSSHETVIPFVQLINETIFSNTALPIGIDFKEDTLKDRMLFENNEDVDIYLIDDALSTGRTLLSLYKLLQETNAEKNLKNILVLVDRASSFTKNEIVKAMSQNKVNKNLILDVASLQVRLIQESGHECFLCKREKNYLKLLKTTQLDALRYQIIKKIKKHAVKNVLNSIHEDSNKNSVGNFIKLFVVEYIYTNIDKTNSIVYNFTMLETEEQINKQKCYEQFLNIYEEIVSEVQKEYKIILEETFDNVFFSKNIYPIIKIEVFKSLIKAFSLPHLGLYRNIKENIFHALCILLQNSYLNNKSYEYTNIYNFFMDNNKVIYTISIIDYEIENLELNKQTIEKRQAHFNFIDIIKLKNFYIDIIKLYKNDYKNINNVSISNYYSSLFSDLSSPQIFLKDYLLNFYKNLKDLDRKKLNNENVFLPLLLNIKKIVFSNKGLTQRLSDEINTTKIAQKDISTTLNTLEIENILELKKELKKELLEIHNTLKIPNITIMFERLERKLNQLFIKHENTDRPILSLYIDLNYNKKNSINKYKLVDVFNDLRELNQEGNSFIYDAFYGLERNKEKNDEIVFSKVENKNDEAYVEKINNAWTNIYIDEKQNTFYKDSSKLKSNIVKKLYALSKDTDTNILLIRLCYLDENSIKNNPNVNIDNVIKPIGIIVITSEGKIDDLETTRHILLLRNLLTESLHKNFSTDSFRDLSEKNIFQNSMTMLSHSGQPIYNYLNNKVVKEHSNSYELLESFSYKTKYENIGKLLQSSKAQQEYLIQDILRNGRVFRKKVFTYNNSRNILLGYKVKLRIRIKPFKFKFKASKKVLMYIFFEFINNAIKSVKTVEKFSLIIEINGDENSFFIKNTSSQILEEYKQKNIFQQGISYANSTGQGLFFIKKYLNDNGMEIFYYLTEEDEKNDYKFGLKISKRNKID